MKLREGPHSARRHAQVAKGGTTARLETQGVDEDVPLLTFASVSFYLYRTVFCLIEYTPV